MKTLIVYYSWSGNTRRVAHQLQHLLPDADEFEIHPVDPYPRDMMTTAEIDDRQKRTENWPRLQHIPHLDGYNQVLIGGPVWTWDLASPVISFLSQIQSYQGIVRPFYTSVGNSQRYAGWFKRRAGKLHLAPGYDDAHDDLGKWVEKIQ